MKKRILHCAAIGFTLLATVTSLRATTDIFSFAGYTFNELNTPNQAVLLGNGAELGGASFSTGYPTQVTLNDVDFPQPSNGFNVSLLLSHLTGLSTTGVRPVRLPNGDTGSTKRHGIEVSWSSGGGVRNGSGADFVIFESASSTNAVEGVMARVRVSAAPETWSDWFYFAPDAFQRLGTVNLESIFSYGFDLSDMGVSLQATVDRIQMANLMPTDRIQTANPVDLGGGIFVGQGKVVFDGSTSVLPDAGEYDTNRRFDGTDTYDPDPLYVAVLHDACESTPPLIATTSDNETFVLSWPAPSCYTLESSGSLTSGSWTDATESILYANGQYSVGFNSGTGNQFFRLKKP